MYNYRTRATFYDPLNYVIHVECLETHHGIKIFDNLCFKIRDFLNTILLLYLVKLYNILINACNIC